MIDKYDPESNRYSPKAARLTQIAIISVIPIIVIWNVFGFKKPGAFWEKSRYSTRVYINLFPENADAKNYRVVATVTHDSDERVSYYDVQDATFPNGHKIVFTDCIISKLHEKVPCSTEDVDANEDYIKYQVELTDQLAK